MEISSPLPRLRQSLAHLYALRVIALQRLSQPLQPATRQMEREHLGTLEQGICDAEARIGQLERG